MTVALTNSSGAVGSGKSEMRRLAIKAIAEVSVANHGKKGYKLGPQVANAQVRRYRTTLVSAG
jgi:hypothetical protein